MLCKFSTPAVIASGVSGKSVLVMERRSRADAQLKLQPALTVIMLGMLPKAPLFPSTSMKGLPACELVLPTSTARYADLLRLARALPRGMPDKLEVSIIHCERGSERCTAAWYGGRAYLIHIALLPRSSA